MDNQPSSQPQSQSTIPIQPQKTPSHLPLAIISVILAGIIFGLLGYWYGQNAGPQQTATTASPTSIATTSPVAIASPSPVPTATATPDPTAGWKTYNSTTEKLSFKYPATWTMKNIGTVSVGPSNSDGISLSSPSGTGIAWSAVVSGLGGGCPPEEGIKVIAVSTEALPSASGLYLITYKQTTNNVDNGNRYYGVINGPAPTAGQTLECPYYTTFKSKVNKTPGLNSEYNDMWLKSSGQVSAADLATVKLIFESLTY